MGFNDQYLAEPELYCLAAEDLPKEAMCRGVISLVWLRNANSHEQLVAICKWFVLRYTDPANGLPYNSQEGGYIWIDGGPYEAREEVEGTFAGLVPDEVLEQAIEIIEDVGIGEWSFAEPFEEDYGLHVGDADESIRETRDRIERLLALLGKENQDLNRLLFASMLSILETYLWQTMSFACSYYGVPEKVLAFFEENLTKEWVNRCHLRKLAERRLADVYWLRKDEAASIFKSVLGMKVSLSNFEQDQLKRHNIVHRFGRDKQGNHIYVSEKDIKELAGKVLFFCEDLHENIKEAVSSIQCVDD